VGLKDRFRLRPPTIRTYVMYAGMIVAFGFLFDWYVALGFAIGGAFMIWFWASS